MAQVTKPTLPNGPARGLFAAGTEASTPATPSPANAAARSSGSARPETSSPAPSFEQTISAAVNKSSAKPADKTPAASGSSPAPAEPACDRGTASCQSATSKGANSKEGKEASVPVTADKEEEESTVSTQAQPLIVSLLQPTSTTTEAEGGDEAEGEQSQSDTGIETQTANVPGTSSDLTLFLAAQTLTPPTALPAPAPVTTTSEAPADSLTVDARASQSANASVPSRMTDGDNAQANSSALVGATRQIEFTAQSNRLILPTTDSAGPDLTTPPVQAPGADSVANAELLVPEVKTPEETRPNPKETARQTQGGNSNQATAAGSPPTAGFSGVSSPENTNPNSSPVEELLSRFQIASRGTSVASDQEVMKTSPSDAAAVSPSSGGVGKGQGTALASAAVAESSLSFGQQPRPDSGVERSKDEKAGSGSEDRWNPSIARPSATTTTATGLTSEAIDEVGRPTDLQSIEMLRNEILTRVVEFGQDNPTSMTVVLRPDQGTELTVHLKSNDGRIEVQVRLEKGNDQAYRASWETLQQSLSQRGVSLANLESATPSALPRTAALAETRIDNGGIPTNLRAIEASVAANGTSANLMSGSDHRDAESRDSRGSSNGGAWDSREQSQRQSPTFSFDEGNLGRESRPTTNASDWTNASRRTSFVSNEADSGTSLVATEAAGSTSGAWESWA